LEITRYFLRIWRNCEEVCGEDEAKHLKHDLSFYPCLLFLTKMMI